MAISKVRIENTTGSKYTLRLTDAETGEEIHASRVEFVWDPNINEYVARIDIPLPIVDVVVPVEVSDGS